jgi:hypothetical protein
VAVGRGDEASGHVVAEQRDGRGARAVADREDNGCRSAELASGYALSFSLTLVDTHSSIVSFSIHGSNVSG